jgi:hypothetical protein
MVTTRCMSEPKVTVAVTHAQLAAIASELAMLAERLKAVANTAKSQPSGSLAMYNWVSVATGMKTLSAFVARAEESRLAAELGKPVKVGQLKPRSVAKKRNTMPSNKRNAARGEANRVFDSKEKQKPKNSNP